MADAPATFPEDCLQHSVGAWWVRASSPQPRRGSLLWSFVPHVDLEPYTLLPLGRSNPNDHSTATFRIQTLRASAPRATRALPVAGIPDFGQEEKVVYRAKRRPVVVVAALAPEVAQHLRRGSPASQTAQMLLVAPYYGADKSGTRAGFNPEFVARIKACEYPQYVWDRLPLAGSDVSILRLDQVRPIGNHPSSYQATGFELSEGAIEMLDEHVRWLHSGILPAESMLSVIRDTLSQVPA